MRRSFLGLSMVFTLSIPHLPQLSKAVSMPQNHKTVAVACPLAGCTINIKPHATSLFRRSASGHLLNRHTTYLEYKQNSMKHNKKNGGRSKPPGRRQNFNTPMNKSFTALSGDGSQAPSDQITMRSEMHAARAVFNTVGSAIMSIRILKLLLTDHTA